MLNGDMSQVIVVRNKATDWQSSPSSTVRRKRFHLVGEPESGQVTSLVEYLPGSSFHRHEHPDGEEILVLEGVFSDESGHWPAGTWLLNPEGFVHAPYSADGCLLFVKLRQYPGSEHKQISWANIPAHQRICAAGTDVIDFVFDSTLMQQPDQSISIVSLGEGANQGQLLHRYEGGVEGFVITGTAILDGQTLNQYDWFRLPPGATLDLKARACTLYLKENNVRKLMSVS